MDYTIVIPVFNCIDYTKKCIKSIYDKSNSEYKFEIIIVDNNSTDGTRYFLRECKEKYSNFNFITNSENLGFAKACNMGATNSKGEYIIFLNNDTEVLPDWDKYLIETIKKDDNIWIIGSKCLYPDGTIQHSGVVFGNDKIPFHIYRDFPNDFPPSNIEIDCQCVTGACFIIKKYNFFNIGGFDEHYINGMEDVDLCLKIIKNNKRIIYQPKSVIIHYESKTPGRGGNLSKNRDRLRKKWKNYIKIDAINHYEKTGLFSVYKKQLLIILENTIYEKHIEISPNLKITDKDNQLLKQKDEIINKKIKELNNIYNSDLWKAATRLNKIAHKTKIIYIFKALITLKRSGIKGLFKKIRNKCKKKIKKYDIIIKIPVPIGKEKEWGDYHFAVSLKKALEKNNYKTHIQFLSEWYQITDDCDIVIVFRGLSKYKPNPKHFNIMWNISHPDKISISEYNEYDYVFVASEKYTQYLVSKVKVPIETLLQCTDTEIFKHCYNKKHKTELLFVGNSRTVFRKIIKDLIPTNYNLSVYGAQWENTIDKKYIKGENILNKKLYKYYSSCKILLNDHWDDMREKGFISNRIFDGFASGAFIISDKIQGAEEIFGDALVTYETKEELHKLIEKYINNIELRKEKTEKGREIVIKNHTFENRAKKIIEIIKKYQNK